MRLHFYTPSDTSSRALQDLPATHVPECHHHLELWFCMAGLQVVGFFLAFAIGRRAESYATWWFVNPVSQVARTAFTFTWAVLLPSFSAWTMLGMSWLADTLHHTPECLSENTLMTPALCSMLQVLCGIGALAYVVFVTNVWDAQRCRAANALAIQTVEDDDLVHRWGRLKPAATMELCGGLSLQDIRDLPRHEVSSDGDQCVICLDTMMKGDHARLLPSCGHVFHRACIDLWLLRSTKCPLCNADTRHSGKMGDDATQ
mmetsp:Transcript_109243/g.189539  ORF Transcript_109243/g.189539 Transcript_109243/m.189539 type:complete len:259 (-) Transcript_109243:8-784(-)